MTSMVQTGYRFAGGVVPRQRPVPVQEEMLLPIPLAHPVVAGPTMWPPEDDDLQDEIEDDEEDEQEQPGRGGRHVALGDRGMATAEYAVATLAACGFAGLLLTVLRGGEVQQMLLGIVRRALTLG